MIKRLSLFFLTVGMACAQAPNFSGVWKANLEKSKLTGPAPSSYLVLIEQQGTKVNVTTSTMGQRGEQRAHFAYNLDGKRSFNQLRGAPMRTTAAVNGNEVTLSSETAGPNAGTIAENWVLSGDGQTLTITTNATFGTRQQSSTVLLEKQPDSAADALRRPEETAGAHYKNVQILKDLPASQLGDVMRSFNAALGVDCEFCHVQGNFPADDKKEKKFARTMLTMTHNINESTFGGKMVVRCYTCHKGAAEPQSSPAFGTK